jgi:PAS domain S-box-containing protein
MSDVPVSRATSEELDALRQRVTELEQAVAAQRDAEERERFLADIGTALADSIDYEQTLSRVARLAVPFLADWCIVDLTDDDGTVLRLACAHADPHLEPLLGEMIDRYPPDPDGTHPVVEVVRSGQSQLIPEIRNEVLDAIARDTRHRELLDRVAPRSGLTVPLIARGRVLGVIELVRSQPEWRFVDADVTLAEELARSAAAAVDNALLYRSAQEALRESEETRAILETVLSSAPIGFALLDRDLRYVRINDFLARLNGVTAEVQLGTALRQSRPGLTNRLEPVLRSVLESGEPLLDIEISGQPDDSGGALRHLLASYYPVRLADGSTLGVGALVTDVTARRQAEDHLRFLAEASEIIAGSLDYGETLRRVARLAVPFLADWCIVYLVQDDGSIARLAMEHANAAHEPVSATIQHDFAIDPNAPSGVPHVIRTGQALLVPDATPEMLAADVLDPDGLRSVARPLGLQSWICVPMPVSGRTIGAISFITSESERRYGPAELALAEDLGRRAAGAVENARLYRVEQETRQRAERSAERISRLQNITAALSQAATSAQVAEAILTQGLEALDAERGMVSQLTNDGGSLEVIGSKGYAPEVLQPWTTFPLEAQAPAAEAVRTRDLVLVSTPQQHAERFPNLARERAISASSALAAAPLIVGDRVIGAIGLAFDGPREFDAGDRAFLLALARQCAQALDRARAYEDARNAVRAREQFLSIASHELKTPLTSIKASAQMIARRLRDEELNRDRLTRFSDQMRSEILRLETLVSDLLDASRIQQGRLDLRPEPTDLAALARVVVERFEHTPTRTPQHRLIIDAGDQVTANVDPARIDQVITNLVSNALKYSPDGGEVRVAIERRPEHVRIVVSDQGIGMTDDEQQRLFEPFARGEQARQQFGGTGLGLFISAEIVERHDGTIAVTSSAGQGSTFTVELPAG